MTDILRMSGTAIAVLALSLATQLAVTTTINAAQAKTSDGLVSDFSSRDRGGRGGGAKVNVNKSAKVNVNRRSNVNVNTRRNVNVNVNRRTTVVAARPVRVWAPRPYYGTFIAGVALGTVIGATTVGVAPVAPGPNLCWFWSDPAMTLGYWDYCIAP
ncbi:MAG: hypothetical protein R3D82_12670 [Xanthobacteraceae bacterium]